METLKVQNLDSSQQFLISWIGERDAGQEICIFNTNSNVLTEMVSGTCFDKHCLGSQISRGFKVLAICIWNIQFLRTVVLDKVKLSNSPAIDCDGCWVALL